ncbi:MAG: helix-turn-helix domain-containing protein [bacterium]
MLSQLEQLRFSRSEARVYAALLDVGATTAGEVIKRSGLHRNIVYECLDKLKDRKLVSQTVKKEKKIYAFGSFHNLA